MGDDMKKEIILDLHGVVFNSISKMVAQNAFKKYGALETAKIAAAYALKKKRDYVAARLGPVIYECARRATVRPGALNALYDITHMPNTTVRVCSCGAFPEYADKIEDFYRNFAPGLADVAHYELLSPYDSKGGYITSVRDSVKDGLVYVADDTPRHLETAYKLQLKPVLISENGNKWRIASEEFGAYTFENLAQFRNFLQYQK